MGKNDPGFCLQRPFGWLGCRVRWLGHHALAGALVVGGVAGALFVVMFTLVQNKREDR